MFRLKPSVLGLCSWSCLNMMNLCGGETDRPKSERVIRPFNISNVKVQLPSDARLYRDQNLSYSCKGKSKISTDNVQIDQLQTYVQKMDSDLVRRTLMDRNNSQNTKILQNLYVTSLGGLNAKTLKSKKVNLLLNATVDLPIVLMANAETIRVPITEKEPDSLNLYVNDVADKIQENYLKDGKTVIYCHDGNRNSIALAAVYLLKYTDLFLSEALLHLQYSRKGFDLKNGNLGCFKKPVENYAKKLKKFDMPGGGKSSSASGAASVSEKKGDTSTSKKAKGKSQAN